MESTHIYDMDKAIGYAVGHAAARIKMGMRRAFLAAGHDVTPDQWVTLYRLLQQDGVTQSELGERAVKDKTAVTRILDRLEAKGLLTRRSDAADRRTHRVHLTEEGRALTLALIPVARAFADAAYASLTEADKDALRNILARIEARLDTLFGLSEHKDSK